MGVGIGWGSASVDGIWMEFWAYAFLFGCSLWKSLLQPARIHSYAMLQSCANITFLAWLSLQEMRAKIRLTLLMQEGGGAKFTQRPFRG